MSLMITLVKVVTVELDDGARDGMNKNLTYVQPPALVSSLVVSFINEDLTWLYRTQGIVVEGSSVASQDVKDGS